MSFSCFYFKKRNRVAWAGNPGKTSRKWQVRKKRPETRVKVNTSGSIFEGVHSLLVLLPCSLVENATREEEAAEPSAGIRSQEITAGNRDLDTLLRERPHQVLWSARVNFMAGKKRKGSSRRRRYLKAGKGDAEVAFWIPMIGMGGIGKKNLTQLIFSHTGFDIAVEACVRVLQQRTCLQREDCDGKGSSLLHRKLKVKLFGERDNSRPR